MTNKEVFKRALKKARKNGLEFKTIINGIKFEFGDPIYLIEDISIKFKKLVYVQVDNLTYTYIGLESIIFSHDFAKAFWGEERICDNCGYLYEQCHGACRIDSVVTDTVNWRYHLQEMVLEKNPLEYLEKFL